MTEEPVGDPRAPTLPAMRPFFIVWTGQAFSLLGSQLVQFAIVWWLTATSGSATVLARATMVALLPQILIAPFAGTLVDRWSRRTILIVADGLVALATLLVDRAGRAGDPTEATTDIDDALALLERIPETERTRQVAARARLVLAPADDYDTTLTGLLDSVKADDAARQQFVDILELMGPDDPRTAKYRKLLTSRLF